MILINVLFDLPPRSEILEYSSCTHPTVMKDMCAECGADLKKIAQRNQTAAVAMVHNIPELMVSMEVSIMKDLNSQFLKLVNKYFILNFRKHSHWEKQTKNDYLGIENSYCWLTWIKLLSTQQMI